MTDIKPYVPPVKPKIMIIGEAPGEEEARQGTPFVGHSGRLLTALLHEVGILRSDCYITNVFLNRPPDNDLKHWCTDKKTADALWREEHDIGKYPYKALLPSKYLKPEYLHELSRLKEEILSADPNLIIALGNTPLWALTGAGGITKLRGTVLEYELSGKKYKLLPTLHPAFVLRVWEMRGVVQADLMKARIESEFPEIRRTPREIWIEPTIEDILVFKDKYLINAEQFSYDIETIPRAGLITCIGFGIKTAAICIPFFDSSKLKGSYWETAKEEISAMGLVKEILQLPNPKVTQNGMYDMQWLWRKWGMTPKGIPHDTQLLHHSMYPEMKKDLGFLGSLYTNEIAWKTFRGKKLEGKKDE